MQFAGAPIPADFGREKDGPRKTRIEVSGKRDFFPGSIVRAVGELVPNKQLLAIPGCQPERPIGRIAREEINYPVLTDLAQCLVEITTRHGCCSPLRDS